MLSIVDVINAFAGYTKPMRSGEELHISNHILAVMLYLSRTEEADLEDLSCTDIEKQWGTLKTIALKEYEAKSLSEMCHVKGQRAIYVKTMPEVTEEMESRWRMKLMQSAPNSEYSLFTSLMRRGDGVVDNGERVISRSVDKTKFPEKLLTLIDGEIGLPILKAVFHFFFIILSFGNK